MTIRRAAGAGAAICIALVLASRSATAQLRDSLIAGRRAYLQADFTAAARLLPRGLLDQRRDSVWVGAVHELTDVLLEQQRDSLAALWARWALRLVPALRIDSGVFPPRVSRTLLAARASVGQAAADTATAPTTWEPAATPEGRGLLRVARAPGSVFLIIEDVGTVLPGESRTLAAGSYTITLAGDGGERVRFTREVLPGTATVVTPARSRAASAEAARAGPSAVRGPTVAAFAGTSCVLVRQRPVCWGDNRTGQLGAGFADSAVRGPVWVAADSAFHAVAVGQSHACGLTASGRAFCWGAGASGQLGHGQNAASSIPVPVAGTQTYVSLVAAAAHTCALTAAGAVYCWGSNRDGELGNRTNTPSPVPVAVSLPQGLTFQQLSAGQSHTCGLTAAGAAWCWGANASGQLGTGNTNSANAPSQVQGSLSFRSIAAGSAHTCGIAATGAAWCWGANTAGQLGTGAPGPMVARPQAVSGGLTNFTAVASGDHHSCAITSDGGAYCWGMGRSGQLGNGQSADSPRPVLVVGGHNFRALNLGASHSCGLTADGVVWCWGENSLGQTGALGPANRPVPLVMRPAPRSAGPTAPRTARDDFNDGNLTADPSWQLDQAIGAQVAVDRGELVVARRGSRGVLGAAGVSIPVRIPVDRSTAIQFDVRADSASHDCGLNCLAWPAVVRLRIRGTDLSETELWLAYGVGEGRSDTLRRVVVIARPGLAPGEWLRDQRFTIQDHVPRADTILEVSLGGIGAD
ncbi:MAG TPA: hypothetical protein VNL98_07425, partial [Gemmatimonadales bacterium]|nr:hypothetical protein [Gemmatimonadales bacterium]